MKESIEIFFCYAREDEELRQGLEKQLRSLQRQGIIDLWHDREIAPGDDWENQIDTHLNSADIILLLISPDFMDSDYCYGQEMKRAVERHNRGEARVIPVIIRHVHWQKSPFGKIQALPTDGIPVTDPGWYRLDIAFYNVAEGIRVVAEALAEKKEAQKAVEEKKRKKAKEEQLRLARTFEDAYDSDNDQAILAAYNSIQQSSNRASFRFSSNALQRIDLARQREQARQGRVSPRNEKQPRLSKGTILRLTSADRTDVGRQEEQNEDCIYRRVESFNDGDRGLFIVADGIEDFNAGEIASRLAVETISKALDVFFRPLYERSVIKLNQADLNPKWLEIQDQFSSAIQQANKAIVRYGEQKSVVRGLGSTMTAALIQNEQAFIANVGDSRTYLYRLSEGLKKVTIDHSVAASLVEVGIIKPDDIYTHSKRNHIYRSLGADHLSGYSYKNVEVDIYHVALQPGDRLLLCSAGLWQSLYDRDLFDVLRQAYDPQEICDALIRLANENGGERNITAIVVDVRSA